MTIDPAPPPTYPFPPAHERSVRDVGSPERTVRALLDPPAELAALRAREPVSRVVYAGEPAWLLTRYDDIRTAMTDRRFVPFIPGIPSGDDAAGSGVLFLMNGPRHARLRRVVAGAFSARRVAALRPTVHRLATGRLAELTAAGPPADLISGYAAPLAIEVLSELLGIDIADRPDFATWSDDVTAMFGAPTPEDMMRSGERLGAFMVELVTAKRDAPGPDLISALIEARDPDGVPLTDDEVHGVASSLLLAGYVPPAQSLALGVLRLLLDPAAAALLRADPTLLPAAVDELLRLDPSGAGSADRVQRATADVELGGQLVRCGEVVVAPLGAANRDPARFGAPDRLDPVRGDNAHLSFALGVHHCLGAALARMELEIGIGALLTGLPTLAPTMDVDELSWRTGFLGDRNLVALPVTW